MNREPPSIGLQRGIVRVVASDPTWPEQFLAETRRIEVAARMAARPPLVFEHIGSTSVPGLPAKPIIDLMAGHDADADPSQFFDVFLGAGYEHREPQGVPNRELFVLGPETLRTHHLNLVAVDGVFWREHLLFRDRLRREPQIAAAYGALKLELARRHPANRVAYTEGKATFVRQVIDGSDSFPVL